jgi:hypothetical protein
VASAGGKISRATVEVQPGATLFLSECYAARQELNSGTQVPSPLGAFCAGGPPSCSEKEQETGFKVYFRLGATYSRETGCTLFALLNSIRAKGATRSIFGCSG